MTNQLTVQLNKTEVLNEIKNANRVLDTKNNLTVTESIILALSPNELRIKGTDGVKYFEAKLAVQTNETVEIALNRELFTKTVEALNSPTFTLEKNNEKIAIKTFNEKGAVVFNSSLFSLNVSDAPTFPSYDLANKFSFTTTTLQSIFDKTAFCVAKQDNSREALRGICLNKQGAEVEFSSTDSYRLSLINEQIDLKTNDFKIILHPQFISEMAKQTSQELFFEFDDSYIVVKADNRVIVFPLIQASYPDVKPLFPKTHTQKIEVKVSEFKSLVESTTFIASKSQNNVFRINVANGEVSLHAAHSDFGSIDLTVEEASVDTGTDFSIALNNTFVKDVLSKMPQTHTLVLELEGKKATFHTKESSTNFKHLIVGIIAH